MILIVKILQAPAKECQIEVTDAESIVAVKRMVARELDVPVHLQRLVFRGKTLADGQSLDFYKIGPGTKIHLVVRRPEPETSQVSVSRIGNSTALWDELKTLLARHFTTMDTEHIIESFKQEFSSNLANLSLDDIERIAKSKLEASDRAGPST
ncbi:ubiquitin-like protein 4A [Diadema setosum]|uniref:ubiquitin-like protein 4A n=1 Tax=Diadema setosum TaxID=31175 RepID=UPI003B3A4925